VGIGTTPAHGAARPAHTAALRMRAHDFLSLTKPRVLVLVLIATGLGWVMAAASLDVSVLAHALLGTALVAGGTAALNQYSEHASARRRQPRHGPPALTGRAVAAPGSPLVRSRPVPRGHGVSGRDAEPPDESGRSGRAPQFRSGE